MDLAVQQSLRNWLDTFSRCVREKDYSNGRAMFSNDVVGYGTWTDRMVGMDSLFDNQWSNVWPRTEGFTFDQEHAHFWLDNAEQPTQCTIAALWSSTGVGDDGERVKREGRSTIVLQRVAAGEWYAMHTHFSFFPRNNLTGTM